MILFIRNKNAIDVIAKADACVRQHANFRAAKAAADPDRRREYTLVSASNDERRISLALLPVVIPE